MNDSSPVSHPPDEPASDAPPVVIGSQPLTIDDVCAIARGRRRVTLNGDAGFVARLDASSRSLERQLRAGKVSYGVTTGVGESCETAVPVPMAGPLALNLVRFRGCGTGAARSDEESGAVVAVRLASLSRGHSGVRPVVLERLVDLLGQRILPRIPSEGSVGASGDLTPLSYVAAALVGEREVSFRGQVVPAKTALESCGLRPLVLQPKESLALMNGTSMMTGLACLAFARARRLARLAAALTAGASDVLRGNPGHFDKRIFDLKPHPGQAACARWIREDVQYDPAAPRSPTARVQDRYSIRCAPHVIGVLLDGLAAFGGIPPPEVNSPNHNPLLHPATPPPL